MSFQMHQKLFFFFLAGFFFPIAAFCKPRYSTESFTDSALAKFDRQKFGMFVHWGLYSALGGEWEGIKTNHIGEHIMKDLKIPRLSYRQSAKDFKANRFNAQDWVNLAKEAGMQYVVITAKHHDGFAMFDSEVSAYNIVKSTPFGQDPLSLLAEACAREEMDFGFYYSHTRDWAEYDAVGNTWDWPKDRKRDFEAYLQNKAFPQVTELLTRYGRVSHLWYDTPDSLSKDQAKQFYDLVKRFQPDCLVNGRIGWGLGDYEQMGDNQVPVDVRIRQKWETPATLNNTWGYKKDDQAWKSADDLLFRLVDVISKGGNYLLNIGPDGEGRIPDESVRILREVGAWVKRNGEAVYGTSHSPFYPQGVSWRCTTKPGMLYLSVFVAHDELVVPGLESSVLDAVTLTDGKSVAFVQHHDGVVFKLPKGVGYKPFVIKVHIADEHPRVKSGFRFDDALDVYELHSRVTRMVGNVTYDSLTQTVSDFAQVKVFPSDELWWNLICKEGGAFDVYAVYACDSQFANGNLRVDVRVTGNNVADERELGMSSKVLSVPIRQFGTLSEQLVGSVHLKSDMNYRFIVKPENNEVAKGLRINRLVLKRKREGGS